MDMEIVKQIVYGTVLAHECKESILFHICKRALNQVAA